MSSSPSGELSWWGIVLVGNCPISGELFWCGVVLVGSRPGGELSGWESFGWELSLEPINCCCARHGRLFGGGGETGEQKDTSPTNFQGGHNIKYKKN